MKDTHKVGGRRFFRTGAYTGKEFLGWHIRRNYKESKTERKKACMHRQVSDVNDLSELLRNLTLYDK